MSSVDKMKRNILRSISDRVRQCNAKLEYNFFEAEKRIENDEAFFSDRLIVENGLEKIDYKLRKKAEQFVKNLPPDLDMVCEPSVSVSFYTIAFSWNRHYLINITKDNVDVRYGKKRLILPNVNVQGKHKETMNNFFLDLSIELL